MCVVLVGVCATFGQFPQAQRSRERLDQSIKASEDREHDRRLEAAATLPVPKKAVMNVDVQMVLSKTEHKTFAEAKAAEAKKIVDGEPVWMYVKFKGKLGDYVLTTRHPQDRERLRYTLYAEVAPRGDVTALHQVTLQFAKEDLAATEVKFNLAPGLFGRNRSIPVFLMTASGAKTGVWSNDIRLTNSLAVPRGLTDNLATAPVTLDLSAGGAKYRKMDDEYDSIIIRGTTDAAKMPIAGTFFDEDVRAAIAARLGDEGIKPIKLFFSGDDWMEFSSFGLQPKRVRKVFAAFTYRDGDACYYGVAEVVENYDFMESKYREAEIGLERDFAVACSYVE